MSVPFEISEVHAGFSEVKGVLRTDDEFLVFDFRTITMGVYKRPAETIKIEFAALSDIRHEKRIFRDRLLVRPRTRQLLEAMPGKHLGEIKLKIWRRYRPSLGSLIDEVQFQIRKHQRIRREHREDGD